MQTLSNSPTKVRTEHAEQRRLIAWVRSFCPGVLVFAIPNGGSRDPREARNLKVEGVLAGIPDLMVAEPALGFHGLFIEMKRTKGSRLTDAQRAMHILLTERGYCVRVCYGCDAARAVLVDYLGLDEAR